MMHHRTLCIGLMVFLACGLESVSLWSEEPAAGFSRGRQVWVKAKQPIVVAVDGKAEVELVAKAVGFSADAYTWSQVKDRINPLRSAGKATFSGEGKAVTATLSAPGVYQFRVVARGEDDTATGYAWVQVWDDRTPLSPMAASAAGTAAVLGTGPGIRPPTSVRWLKPPPKPFEHPRVLFSDDDWPEMSRRAKSGKVARWGVQTIRKWVDETLNDPKTPTGKLATDLNAWAESGGTGPTPDLKPLAGDAVLSGEARGVFYSMLLDACYLLWLDCDPAVPPSKQPALARKQGRALARVTAAAATLHLRAIWDRRTGAVLDKDGPLAVKGLGDFGEPASGPALCDLAVAYDLIYDWMEEDERQAVRDFLVAVGYGRHTAPAGFSHPHADQVKLGNFQNGDFSNMNDQHILVMLAVEGEEKAATADIREAFCKSDPGRRSGRWMRPTGSADTSAWPTATVAAVDNLERQIRWLVDWNTTPWGLAANHLAYLGLSAKHMMPATVALARRGENLFVTTHLYQLSLHALQSLHPAEAPIRSPHGLGETRLGWWDHHDSPSFGQRGTMAIIWKYMYPDDPLIDYVWRAYLPTLDRDPLMAAMFGIDPSTGVDAQTLPEVAAAKGIPTTLFDPQRGIVTMQSEWSDEAASLWFDCCGSDPYQGHMHAERNAFDFYALGRAWSIAPGYHVTISDAQAAVLVRDPRHADDPATGGFIGESPSSATTRPPHPGNHPTPPGRMLEVTESPAHTWTLAAGDATCCYTYGYRGKREIDTGLPLESFLYPGMKEVFLARSPEYRKLFAEPLKVSQNDYNPMRHVIRSVLFVRGPRPYVLVVDDCDKDGQPHDWRWCMNCAQGFAPGLDTRFVDGQGKGVYSSLAIAPGATPQEAVLLHSPIDDERRPGQAGLPRLLVRDLGPAATPDQPAIMLESRPPGGAGPYLTYGYDNNRAEKVATPVPTNRVLIERRQVTRPDYVVLLFPFRTGTVLPETSWNADRTVLTVAAGDGVIDTIRFDRTHEDHRTRLAFNRTEGGGP